MPSFPASGPATIKVEVEVATIRVRAEERADTSVELGPTDPADAADRAATDAATVEGGPTAVVVRSMRSWRRPRLWGQRGAIDIALAVPVGSSIDVRLGGGSVECGGQLGACRLSLGSGDVRLGAVATTRIDLAAGDLRIDAVEGAITVSSAAGRVDLGSVTGSVSIKTSHGPTSLGDVGGDLRWRAASGDLDCGRVGGRVSARTAAGSVRIGATEGPEVGVHTAAGDVGIGIPEGMAAWLDLHTSMGRVRNELAAGAAPAGDERRVEVRARTSTGDITVRRSAAPMSAARA